MNFRFDKEANAGYLTISEKKEKCYSCILPLRNCELILDFNNKAELTGIEVIK